MRTLALLIVVLVVAACTSSNDTQDAAGAATTVAAEATVATTMSPTTTVAPTTSTVAPTTTTTVVATTTTTVAATTTTASTTTTTSGGPYVVGTPEVYPGSPLPGSAGAGGSGCSPGAGPLPDGVWFGYVHAIGATSINFDLACLYTGDLAVAKGAEDGVEVEIDYYIRNASPTLRTVPVITGATVYELDVGYVGYLTVTYPNWPVNPADSIVCPSSWCGVWVFVNGGEATEILEQYFP